MWYNHVHSLQFCSKPWCLVQHVHSAWDRRCCKKRARGDWQGSTGFIDWSISRITAALKQAGCDDNTLTFFTSANGRGRINAPLSGFKGQILQGNGAVACKIRPGSASIDLVATYDIFTTMV
eukprot:gene19093-23779_t